MTSLQFAIGALNDLVDAPADRGRPGKPIPNGQVSSGMAGGVVVAGLAIGLGLSAISGPAALAVAALGSAIGLAYDIRLKGTPWAPLAYAVGLPLLPVYAWLGATGQPPPGTIPLLGAGALAGVGLALGNALVDPDGDRSAGSRTPVVALGAGRAWRVMAVLQALVSIVALVWLAIVDAGVATLVLAAAAVVVVATGVMLQRSARSAVRERGWEVQAVGIAGLAAGWLIGTAV
jgi:4-hydroxybenzoate polyprenyltransferase